MDLPSHPETDDASDHTTDPATAGSRAMMIGLVIVGAVVVLIIVLHLTGVVGPRSH